MIYSTLLTVMARHHLHLDWFHVILTCTMLFIGFHWIYSLDFFFWHKGSIRYNRVLLVTIAMYQFNK